MGRCSAGVVAHEMAHAVIETRDIPMLTSEEAAADELAAITLVAAGMERSLISLSALPNGVHGGGMFMQMGLVPALDISDEHPPHGYRAAHLACMIMGGLRLIPDCKDVFQGASVCVDEDSVANPMYAYQAWSLANPTRHEEIVERAVARLGERYRTQHLFMPVPRPDFALLDSKITIEVDGKSHDEPEQKPGTSGT